MMDCVGVRDGTELRTTINMSSELICDEVFQRDRVFFIRISVIRPEIAPELTSVIGVLKSDFV
jgi:hypothetical protein